MKKITILILISSFQLFSQQNLKELLGSMNTESIPYISVEHLKNTSDNILLLDAREKREYKVSHLKNALFVGYNTFDLKKTVRKIPDKKTPIVVYCSLGVRSEDIAEQLQKAGFKNVLNLYGGIFEWKNKGYEVVTSKNKVTEKVHAYSKEWSKWLLKGEKTYE